MSSTKKDNTVKESTNQVKENTEIFRTTETTI